MEHVPAVSISCIDSGLGTFPGLRPAPGAACVCPGDSCSTMQWCDSWVLWGYYYHYPLLPLSTLLPPFSCCWQHKLASPHASRAGPGVDLDNDEAGPQHQQPACRPGRAAVAAKSRMQSLSPAARAGLLYAPAGPHTLRHTLTHPHTKAHSHTCSAARHAKF
jgi:hypothetical protein